ncbi:Ig-like domain-containing protein [Sphaerobacter thermophilus]|uniref:Ig domain protein group 1 domain protein n=1 Tax=Sphaerobacter thermophilus (strain ATCC 49802 / DSM 20745 / KCCM 41009 / NCIMB 13125 / S 6022) TaxID=479434 RepID=D1C3Z9_SPHTD|nr:Ig-like domain-containing protein [Sphaerobacter thermophilus]ACZ38966.1 Ig domain protein group 1 domain protein [Sphaerobacter thermophilus DSM 20745]
MPAGGGGIAVNATWQSSSGKAAPPRITGVVKQAAPASSAFRGVTDGTMAMVDGYAGIPQADVAWGSSSTICSGSATDCNDLDAFLEGLPADVARELEFDGRSFLPIVQAGWFGWETVIHITNIDASGSGSSTAQLTFFGSSAASGTTIGPITVNVPRGTTTTIDVGSTLANNGYTGAFVGSVMISSSHAMVASATRVKAETQMALTNTATPLPYVEVDMDGDDLADGGAADYEPVGGGTYTLFAPLVFHNYNGWNTGINIANLSDSSNTVTVEVYGRDGSPLGTYSRNIAARGMEYVYIPEVSTLAANDFGTAVLSASQPFHAVVDEVKYETGEAMAFLAIPANARAGAARTGALGIPLFQKGLYDGASGDTSGLNLFNPSGQNAFGNVTFYNAVGAPQATVPFNLPARGTALIYAPEIAGLGDGQTTSAVVQTSSGAGVVTAVSNVVNYDVVEDGGAVFNVVNPLGQFRLVCTETGCGYLLLASDGSLQVMAPWKGGEPTSAPAAVKVEASATKLSVDDEVTITATVTDHLGRPVANTNVNFVVETTGLANQGIGSATTDGQGKATFKYKQQKVGKDKVTATATAGPVSGEIEIEWTAGAPKSVDLTVDKDEPQVEETVTFTATVKDQYENLVPGVEVAFTTDSTSVHPSENQKANTGTSGDTLGKATLAFTGKTKAGIDRWKATAGTASSSELTVTWKPGAPDSLTLEVDKKTPTVGDKVTFTATVKDKHGNPIPNLTVSFATTGADDVHDDAGGQAPTNASGVATYQFTDDTPQGTGTDHWTASIADGPSAGVDVVWRAGNPHRIGLTVQDDKTSPKAGEQVTLVATVYDVYDNVVDWFGDNGEKIFFRTQAGAVHPQSGYKDVTAGVAIFTVSETSVGQDVWEAVRDAITSNPVTIVWQPGDFTKIALTVDRTSQTVGSRVQFTATLQDTYGNTVDKDDEVTFVVTQGSNVGRSRKAVAVNGVAVRAYGPNQTEAGDQTWKATYGGVDSNEVTVTCLAGPADKVALEVDDTNPSVNGQIKLTAKVLDANGNPVTNASGTVTFETVDVDVDTNQSSIHKGATGTADLTNGQATWYFTGGTKTGVDHWQATFDGLSGQPSAPVTVTWGSAAAHHILLTTDQTDHTATAGTAVTLTATVKDQWDNVVTGQVGKIRFSQTGTPANSNAGDEVDLLNGEAQFQYTGTKAGQDQWQAQLVVDGSVVGDVDADQVTVTWVAGPAAQLLVTPEGTITRQVGGTARLVATVLDEFGNPVKDQTVTFKLTGTTREGVTPPDPLHSGTSNRNGRVIFDYKDVLVSGTDTITVTVDSLPETEVQRTVVWEPGPVATIELTFAPNPPTAGADVTVTATLKDQGGNAVPDTEVRLMSVPGSRNTVDLTATTGATGMASLTYTGATDSAEKTDTLWALASGDGGSVIVSNPLQITWTGPAPDSITLSVSKENPSADDTNVELTATLYAGATVADWIDSGTVVFSVASPKSTPQGTAEPDDSYVVTVIDGKATLLLDGNLAGTETWTAKFTPAGGAEISNDLAVTWSPGAVATVTLDARKSGATSDQWVETEFLSPWNDTVEFRVIVRDAKGNGIPNQTVTIQTTGGTAHHGQAGCSSGECQLTGTTGGTGGFSGTFTGEQAGYDDWAVTVDGKTATIRIVWEPEVTFEASTNGSTWTSSEPITASTNSRVDLRATITGFQCSALFDAGQPTVLGEKLLFEQNPRRSSVAFVKWECAGDPEVATATGWAEKTDAGEITFTVRLNLDGDSALNPTIGEVEKSVTVTWGP